MPIEEATLFAAARKLQDHLNRLLSRTLTETHLTVFSARRGGRVNVVFRQSGEPIEAVLITKFDRRRVRLGIRQLCEGIPQRSGRVRLQTILYRYTITPDGDQEPLFRWEYEKQRPSGFRACRHHLHSHVSSESLGIQLLRLHLPTGYTLIEDIIRFCIDDLGVEPRSAEWHDLLEESERIFKEEFAPARADTP